MPFNTRNPIPSGDLRDLDDNARNIDTWANDKTKLSHPDRFGVERYTWHGIEQKVDDAIANLGFFPPVDYTTGLNVDSRNFTVAYNGVVYAAQPSAVPFTTGAWDAAQWYPIQNLLNQKNLLVFGTYAEASAAAATLPDGQAVLVSENGSQYKVASGALVFDKVVSAFLSFADFKPAADGVTDDTAKWNAFQAAAGLKCIPAGRYLVNGEVLRFDKGVIGNGVFDDASATWEQPQGDRERDSLIVHGRYINANSTLVSPVIKTQTHIDFTRDVPSGSFKHVVGSYHEATYDGHYNTREDTNQNFTVLGSSVKNKMAGLFGSLAFTGRALTAKETENPLIETMGAPKQGVMFAEARHNTKHASGGYSFNYEGYLINGADETEDVPYQNNDEYSFLPWTTNAKFTGGGNSPISSAILMHGLGGKHGYWNGVVIGASMWNINGNKQGPKGTVAINMASQRASVGFADIGIKFRTNNRHLYFREGAKIRSSHTRFMYESGGCGISIEGTLGGSKYINFRTGADDSSGGGTVNNIGQISVTNTQLTINSPSGELIFSPVGTPSFRANSARFAPVSDDVMALGSSTARWTNIFASTATINTSDGRVKQDIRDLSEAERRVAVKLKGMLKAFRFKDAVQAKGDDARIHFGVIAQDVLAAFAEEGLDARRYALFCHDTWEAVPEQQTTVRIKVKEPVYEQVLIRDEYVDDRSGEPVPAEYVDGEMLEDAVYEDTVTKTPAVEAGDLYGIRYEELMAFIISAL